MTNAGARQNDEVATRASPASAATSAAGNKKNCVNVRSAYASKSVSRPSGARRNSVRGGGNDDDRERDRNDASRAITEPALQDPSVTRPATPPTTASHVRPRDTESVNLIGVIKYD
jgi:hypothetical protein